MLRALTLVAVITGGAPAMAIDANLTGKGTSTHQHVCEQLLNADLSGYYVASNLNNGHSSLVQLRPLGSSGSYVISTVRINLPAEGFRQLEFERLPKGWLVDPKSDRRVSVMSIDRSDSEMLIRFEDTIDSDKDMLFAKPATREPSVRGNILKPDAFQLTLRNGTETEVRFTRLDLDRAMDSSFSMPLKSFLATRLNDEDSGDGDYVFTVETKRPMTTAEACELLQSKTICSLEHDEDPDQRYYKFAVAQSAHEFLESVGTWLRNWEVTRFDIQSLRGLSDPLKRRLVQNLRSDQPLPLGSAKERAALMSNLEQALTPLSESGGRVASEKPTTQPLPPLPRTSTRDFSPTLHTVKSSGGDQKSNEDLDERSN
ncbi:MAG: hypothetical protein KF799_11340 [Bdellovibrionales bacterium]|nr:hypothetical protein [Bdellovibrionales bacterium]